MMADLSWITPDRELAAIVWAANVAALILWAVCTDWRTE
jgi:hypothetical protein